VSDGCSIRTRFLFLTFPVIFDGYTTKRMKHSSQPKPFLFYVLAVLITTLVSCSKSTESTTENNGPADIETWITTGDKSKLLEKSASGLNFVDKTESKTIITIDTSKQFQSIDGFGYALTGGSAWLLHEKLDLSERDAILKELFLTDDKNIGVSYLRVSIGASDLDAEVFSYHDKKDVKLSSFDLGYDKKHLVPVLKEILKLGPDIKIMGSPWTAPSWMKTNNLPKGGSLKPEYYDTYALYFVKYIQAMKAEGIVIDAVTLQNEPENPGNTPSMLMTAQEQALFVKKHLGPAFEKEGIKTKIVVFDHNCDHPEYPITVLNDADAKKYIDGSAFHLYLGQIEAMSKVHDAHPDKNLYFTEQWTSGQGSFGGDLQWHVKNLIVGSTRNWSRNVLEWNLAADPQFNPHTGDGGCTLCQGALTIGDSVVSRNVSYYIIAHASKFVRPGAVRVESNVVDGIYNVAFVDSSGKKILVVVNENPTAKDFAISFKGKVAEANLPAGAVATYVW
jgi:glucosylceramidase